MKLLIIGLDGLDYNIVLRWNLRDYLQEYYGKHYVGFACRLYTPILWGMFLTGINVEEHGYNLEKLKEKRSLEVWKYSFLRKMYMFRKKIPIKKLGIRPILVTLGLARKYPPSIMPDHLLRQTFIEELKSKGLKTAAIEVPGYNETINEKYRSLNKEYIFKNITEKLKFLKEIINDCRNRILKAQNFVLEGYDLVFVYLPLPDIAHHLLFRNLREIVELRKVYGKIMNIIKPLTACSKDYAILIVSDHGFDIKEQYHSQWGFWSLNVKPPFVPNKITDFKRLVLKIAMM